MTGKRTGHCERSEAKQSGRPTGGKSTRCGCGATLNPALVPGIYTKLMDIDKVDLLISSYGTNLVVPAMPVGELGLDTKMLGGGLAGLQAAAIKMQLGEAANGVVNVDLWEPVPTMQFPGVMDFIKKYQAKAPAEGVDLLGYFLPPFAYSELQILGDAITATKTLDDDKLAEYMHSHPFQTIEGDIAFGPDGEWTQGAADLGAVPRHQGA
jgi:ABC-type branched-subunit amino acid transport system substrate-binding protein